VLGPVCDMPDIERVKDRIPHALVWNLSTLLSPSTYQQRDQTREDNRFKISSMICKDRNELSSISYLHRDSAVERVHVL
jgi:hypothetical protein